MRRSQGFVPRVSRRKLRWGWLFSLLPAILVYWVWMYVRMLHGSANASPDGNPDVRLTASGTREMWQGDPIYSVTNQSSQTLDHVSIQNWANQVVAIYALGKVPLGNDANAQRFPTSPVNLSPGQTLYFLGTAKSTAPYTFMWTIDGQPYFTTLMIPALA